MFSPEVVCDDKFIDMPSSTQALYFQLGMHADDDGFVGPKKVMRIMGASEDDLKILIAKKFVMPFESGVIVVRHWKVNNLIRKDWYRPTTHQEERHMLSCSESGVYRFVNELAPSSSTQVGSKVVSKLVIASKEAENAGIPQGLASIGDNLRKKRIV